MPSSPESAPPSWLLDHVETIPDFPEPGIMFRDLSPLWRSSSATSRCAIALADGVGGGGVGAIDVVVGIEARGFIVGMAVAQRLGVGFVPARKPGKLPGEVLAVDYDLEYGSDRVELQVGAIESGERVLIVDDVIATGGTAAAVVALVASAGGAVAGVSAVLELEGLGGRTGIQQALDEAAGEGGPADVEIMSLWLVGDAS